MCTNTSRLLVFLLAAAASAQQVPVQEFTLANGMKLLMVPRKGDPNVAAGWVARVGSVNERPGITGISHLFEHMMFKGTHPIRTTNIDQDLKTLREMDAVRAELRQEEESLIERQRRGQIADSKDPKVRSPRHTELLAKYDALVKQARQFAVKNEFDRIYRAA